LQSLAKQLDEADLDLIFKKYETTKSSWVKSGAFRALGTFKSSEKVFEFLKEKLQEYGNEKMETSMMPLIDSFVGCLEGKPKKVKIDIAKKVLMGWQLQEDTTREGIRKAIVGALASLKEPAFIQNIEEQKKFVTMQFWPLIEKKAKELKDVKEKKKKRKEKKDQKKPEESSKDVADLKNVVAALEKRVTELENQKTPKKD